MIRMTLAAVAAVIFLAAPALAQNGMSRGSMSGPSVPPATSSGKATSTCASNAAKGGNAMAGSSSMGSSNSMSGGNSMSSGAAKPADTGCKPATQNSMGQNTLGSGH